VTKLALALVRPPAPALALPARSLGIVAAAAVVAALAYAGTSGLTLFAVSEIEVTGAPPDVAREVRATVAPFAGTSLARLDGEEVIRRVEALPSVRAVEYDREFPATLRLVVHAERPTAVVRFGDDAWLVSERGRVLRALPGSRPSRLPRIWVAQLSAPRDGAILDVAEALRPALALGAVLAADPAFIASVREARMRESEIDLVLRSGTELRLGSPDDLTLKIAVAQAVLKATPHPGEGYIDVSVPVRPVTDVESQVSG
jgi:cell division protein FtsQ